MKFGNSEPLHFLLVEAKNKDITSIIIDVMKIVIPIIPINGLTKTPLINKSTSSIPLI